MHSLEVSPSPDSPLTNLPVLLDPPRQLGTGELYFEVKQTQDEISVVHCVAK